MLHERTDFPPGTTRYTAGWRVVGASLSDVAAMGAAATAAVAVYADAAFDEGDLDRFVAGAIDVCEAVDAEYVGGDLDTHDEFTTASTAIGDVTDAGVVTRSGAPPATRSASPASGGAPRPRSGCLKGATTRRSSAPTTCSGSRHASPTGWRSRIGRPR